MQQKKAQTVGLVSLLRGFVNFMPILCKEWGPGATNVGD